MKKFLFLALIAMVFAGLTAGADSVRSVGAQIAEYFFDDPDVPASLRAVKDQFTKEDFMMKRARNIDFYRGLADGPVDRFARSKAISEKETVEREMMMSLNTPQAAWTPIGPFSIPNGQTEAVTTAVSGRVSAIAVHPANPNIVYVGAAQGGVFRSLDGGATWTPIFDNAQSLAIGAIAIAPSDPTIVYVGTGEAGGSCDSFFGVGIYRINDADTTANLSGPFASDGTNDVFTGRSVSKIVVDPQNPDIIFAATTSGIGGLNCEAFGGGFLPPLPGRGLFRSTNATGAMTFTKMVTATAVSGVAGNFSHTDIVLVPGGPLPSDPRRVAVGVNALINPAGGGTGGGVYLSTDALAPAPIFTRTLPVDNGTAGVRIELAAQSAAGVTNIYAASGESSGRLRRSTDGGATWSPVLSAGNGFCAGQCFYDIALAVDPTNPENVLLGGNVTGASSKLAARSTNGGTSFTHVNSGVHADNHVFVYAPSDPNIVYMGTDGGIYRSTDNGQTWANRNTSTFSATQFQSIAVHPTDPNFTIGGTQDNGTQCLGPCGTIAGTDWRRADFGDGGHAAIDQNATDTTNVTMYHTYFNQSGAKGFARVLNTSLAADNGWTLFGCGFGSAVPNGLVCSGPTLFYAPLTLGGGNPNSLYFGADRLYRSTNSGVTMATVSQTFSSAISAIGVAKQDDNVRVIGLADGRVFATATGANPMTQMNIPVSAARGVGRIAVDPVDANVAYVAFTGFALNPGHHIWKTTNLSAANPTWVVAGTGIPDVPVNALAIDLSDPSRIYAGTDIGVYSSGDAGATWAPYGTGLPRVAVFDMAIAPGTPRMVRIATHGRGVWQTSVAGTLSNVSISGRVTTPDGRGLRNAVVTLTSAGATRQATTSSFGLYTFSDVAAGATYSMSVLSKRYRFGSQSVTPAGDLTNVDFTAQN